MQMQPRRGKEREGKREENPLANFFASIAPSRFAFAVSSFLFIPAVIFDAADDGFGGAVEDSIAAAVFDGFFCEEPLVAVEVAVNLLGGFSGPFAHQPI